MIDVAEELLAGFANAKNVAERWDFARRLMAGKHLTRVVDRPEFASAWSATAKELDQSSGLEQALAIDLLIRISAFVKKLRPSAEKSLASGLTSPPVDLSEVSETKALPAEAKPAEIRENIAVALKYATGDWRKSYTLRALSREDRSQRCRVVLLQRLAELEPRIGMWFVGIAQQPAIQGLVKGTDTDSSAALLRDFCAAFAETIRNNRRNLIVSVDAGKSLAEFIQMFVDLRREDKLPRHLEGASVEVASLLDEILSTQLKLIVEPDAYLALEIMRRWWAPLSYPKKARSALESLRVKILTAIELRARLGQRSEELAHRLIAAVGDAQESRRLLRELALSLEGLSPQVFDWLTGTARSATSSSALAAEMLSAVSENSLMQDLALVAAESSDLDSETGEDALRANTQRLLNIMWSVLRRHNIELIGMRGDAVEFNPIVNETLDNSLPKNVKVRIMRPGAGKRRADGSLEILLKSLVATGE